MKSLTLSLVLASLCALPVLGSAATATASFQASLTIIESCAIDNSAKGPAPAPTISCSHASAYRIDAAPAGAPMQQNSNGNILTVTF
ncbi:hypothetical protein HF313_10965 [Massilia atriviolacea]|uniref:Spore coat protein U domain-containing protein n=1 Tax=Massilia atriviolacea TaxID=2495579 RepID=A0A430HIE7_9BURK|nr:hypothetical protein [Massilia atriviolacea]RSZ57271.1 hypothetical protein EJB06_19085 [Massilia atriviolacea]